MGFLGFIIILPFAALAIWSLRKVHHWLWRDVFPREWRRAFWIAVFIGILLGLVSDFHFRYQIGKNVRMHGFPLPVRFEQRNPDTDTWVESEMPVSIHAATGLTDLLAIMALCIAPIAVGAFLRQNREQNSANLPGAEPKPTIPTLKFMVIAGEPSGDLLAADLVSELRAQIKARDSANGSSERTLEFFGAGGPEMQRAGVSLAFDMTIHSVTGLSDVLKNYFKFRRLFRQLYELAVSRKPDVIICVDFSGFNRRFGGAVQDYVRHQSDSVRRWQPKLVQFISPQVWASREGRIHSIARDFDLLLSIFPFEKEWYAKRVPQLRVEFVGHPMVKRFAAIKPNPVETSSETSDPLILLLPGSRRSELERHLPAMIGAWQLIQKSFPHANPLLVLPNNSLTGLAEALQKSNDSTIPLQIGNLSEALKRATIAIASTGTVTMECAFFGVPTVTLYRTSWSTFQIGKRIIKVNSLTMPNLLAGKQIFPEFIQHDATAENLGNAAIDLIKNAPKRQEIKAALKQITSELGAQDATTCAAKIIGELLQ